MSIADDVATTFLARSKTVSALCFYQTTLTYFGHRRQYLWYSPLAVLISCSSAWVNASMSDLML